MLEENNFIINFDFLSIDVDGCDYYLFESLTKYKPKLICIEYNPTIPNDVEFIQESISIKPIDYYYTNSIARSSKVMSECRNISKKFLFTGIEKAS